jgi:hypothetical protein
MGQLFWKHRPDCQFVDPKYALTWNKKHEGKRAGGKKGRGYRMVRIDGVAYLEHRVIFALANNADPGRFQIDHRKGNGSNAPANLRLATHSQNLQNRRKTVSNNTSGVRGVHWSTQAKRWMAIIPFEGKRVYLGVFKDLKEAAKTRRSAERFFYGEFS